MKKRRPDIRRAGVFLWRGVFASLLGVRIRIRRLRRTRSRFAGRGPGGGSRSGPVPTLLLALVDLGDTDAHSFRNVGGRPSAVEVLLDDAAVDGSESGRRRTGNKGETANGSENDSLHDGSPSSTRRSRSAAGNQLALDEGRSISLHPEPTATTEQVLLPRCVAVRRFFYPVSWRSGGVPGADERMTCCVSGTDAILPFLVRVTGA